MTLAMPRRDRAHPPLGSRLQLRAFHALAGHTLRRFEARTAEADAVNRATLREIIRRNRTSEFGQTHGFLQLPSSEHLLVAAYRRQVPLSTYADYAAAIDRIALGEDGILTTEPIRMFAGSAGTTGTPKRIPRTQRAQRQQFARFMIEQGVLDRAIPAAGGPRRGINLMSLYSRPNPAGTRPPVYSGPNAGMARIRRQIPLLWTSPVPVFGLAHQSSAQYVHALFGLLERESLYLETLFAPQAVSWLTLLTRRAEELMRDLHDGTLSPGLELSEVDRKTLKQYLPPSPERAAEVAKAFRCGTQGLARQLWPNLTFVRTITSGSFALSVPTLRRFLGPDVPIYSGCHSASEGVIGINLAVEPTDGEPEYTLAVGSGYYEFIAITGPDAEESVTVGPDELEVGRDYEVVLTSFAGLYRYRLGDVVRVTGWHRNTPRFSYRYRRGTLLNLVGEKTTEFHTSAALSDAITQCLGSPSYLKEYSVAAEVNDATARYVFYVELQPGFAIKNQDVLRVSRVLDEALCRVNPYYASTLLLAERLGTAQLRTVKPGTFERLQELQLRHAGFLNQMQVKTPRVITRPEHRALLERQALCDRTDADADISKESATES